jgi:cytochrome c-type biogenesis protein CcmH/NrfG
MLQHPLLGSGPGTFAIDYGLFSSPALNSSLFWDTRFSAAKSEFLTLLATHGVLGTALLLSLPIILLFFALKRVVSTRDDWRMVVPPFLGGLTLFIAFFLFVFTLTEVMLAVVFLAWAAALVLPPTRSISHSHSPRLALLSSFGTFVGVIGVLVATFLSFTRYGAELTFAKAVARSRENAPKADIISLVNSAATLNKYNDTYYRNLANILLLQTSELAADPKADPKAISGYLSASVNSAMRAVAIGPNTVMNWEMLGTVYREFSSVVTDANTHALEAYTQATLLSPSNPKYLVGLARVYLVRADMLTPRIQGSDKDEAAKAKDQQAEALLKAGEALKKAIALKSDYAAARYYAAFVEERKGNLSGAVQSMETARALSKNDIGVSIQLSLLYLRQGKNDLAAKELERAQTLDPKNDNVKWYLSVAYEAQGENDKAINLLQDLVKLYPENTTMKSRLEKLEKGEEPVVTPIPEPLEPTVPSTETVPVTPTP